MKFTREINGVLLLNKPYGVSSNHALQQVKRLFQAKKAGHTGSLDPLATGLLPICFGEATKFSSNLLNSDKTYLVTMQLGIVTDTGDREGTIIKSRAVPLLTEKDLETLFSHFRGTIQQTPPLYSAIKYQGQPLYRYARRGEAVPITSRTVQIKSLQLLNYEKDQISFEVNCSKGTYIRSLVEDMGENLECGAHVSKLHRTSVGHCKAAHMVDIPQLQHALAEGTLENYLKEVDVLLSDYPQIILNQEQTWRLQCGQKLEWNNSEKQIHYRIYHQEKFIGLAQIVEEKLKAIRLLNTQPL